MKINLCIKIETNNVMIINILVSFLNINLLENILNLLILLINLNVTVMKKRIFLKLFMNKSTVKFIKFKVVDYISW